MNSIRENPDYMAYHQRVVAAVRTNLIGRAYQGLQRPLTPEESEKIEQAVRFFDVECTYDEDWQRGDDPAEVADENIISADWE